jgi:hypothetical protein
LFGCPNSPNDHLLQVPQVPVKVLPMVAEVDDGVQDKLPWAMIGHLPSPLRAMEWQWRIAEGTKPRERSLQVDS